MRVDDFFGDGVCAYIGEGANAYFHGCEVRKRHRGRKKATRQQGLGTTETGRTRRGKEKERAGKRIA